jgi:hypothetical protein
MTRFTGTILLAAAALLTALPRASADDGSSAIDTARRAIDMGYGTQCSLEMKPVERGGYYPCIDIDPYRIVFAYGTVRAFVVQKDRTPYLIMEAPQDAPDFLSEGPWKSDMSARVALWWADTVEGAAARRLDTQQQSENRKAAEEYVNTLMGKKETPPPAAPASEPAGAQAADLEIDEDIRQILAR